MSRSEIDVEIGPPVPPAVEAAVEAVLEIAEEGGPVTPAADEVHRVTVGAREYVLLGTAHVSRGSVEAVRRVIAEERPDHVCVELDPQRYEVLEHKQKWEQLDLKEVIRKGQLAMLVVSLLLAAYQKRLGTRLGIEPGTELLEAVRAAKEAGIAFSLCDRDVRVTLRRAARAMGFFKKVWLLSYLLASVFAPEELSEEEIQRLKQQDVLSEVMAELAKFQPSIKRVLIDERDAYLAEKLRRAEGRKIVAVVGAGHVQGMLEALEADQAVDLAELDRVAPVSKLWHLVGWGIPATIVGAIVWLGITQGAAVAGASTLTWFLATGIPAGIGTALALAHPLTILAGFVSAPFTTLSPLIGVGHVTALVQIWMCPPVVREFQTIAEDVGSLRRWWGNKLLRIFLAFVLPSLGGMLGMALGTVKIFSKLF